MNSAKRQREFKDAVGRPIQTDWEDGQRTVKWLCEFIPGRAVHPLAHHTTPASVKCQVSILKTRARRSTSMH